MAFVDDAKLDGECFPDVARLVCSYFQIDRLYEDQVKAIKALFKERSVLFCASTGYGKSVVFQSIPLLAGILGLDEDDGSSVLQLINNL